jgi:hypothetical protein
MAVVFSLCRPGRPASLEQVLQGLALVLGIDRVLTPE